VFSVDIGGKKNILGKEKIKTLIGGIRDGKEEIGG
jgi:hypothetical protein